jgi:GxxExxY protein
MLAHRDLSNRIIGLAIEVHRSVGPGLLESVYSECLSDELGQAGIPFQPSPRCFRRMTRKF